MAKNGKPTSRDFDAQRDAEARAAKKKLKEAEKAKAPGAKKEKAEKAPKAKKTRRFWKDFRGEIKKIVWPDFKSVMKNTGIVLLVTVIIGAMVWILDYALSGGVKGLKSLAQGIQAIVETEPDFGDEDMYLTEPETEPEAEPETETEPVTEEAAE